MKIKFIKSPTGAFNLAYSEGEEAEFPKGQADFLIEAGFAIKIKDDSIVEKAVQKAPIEKAVKKK